MDSRRVVVTGIGAVSALGLNAEEFRTNLFAGKSGIDQITSVDVSGMKFQKAGEVRGFNEEEHFEKNELILLDRFTQFLLVAAQEAVKDANIEWKTDEERERTAIITGTGAGGQGNLDKFYVELFCEKKNRFPPIVVPRAMSNAPASQISMKYGIYGPTYTITTACSSSNHAIGQAFHAVRSGMVDRAITGGSETPIAYGNLKTWESMRVVSPDTCRPFSKNRSGMVLGEGGAVLVLETLESAQKRGAEIYCEIAGFGMSADAHHITQPSPDGAVRAMSGALRDAGLEPEKVGYINAHGTATLANDVMETRAIRRVFGEYADQIAVSSTKSMHGHTLGAAGAIEAAATVLALKHGILPPTANFTEPDPECDLDVIKNEARATQVEGALSNSFAFGGLNATLAFKRSDG